MCESGFLILVGFVGYVIGASEGVKIDLRISHFFIT